MNAAVAPCARLAPPLSALFPPGVIAAEFAGPGDAALLFESERRECAGACAKRIEEFAAGRLCARRALHEFGLPDVALPRNADRSPGWPAGFTGSITHTSGYCVAVAAPRGRYAALGIDAEIVGRVTPEIWPYVSTPAERGLVDALPAARRAAVTTLVFSAKEAFYKCQHALTGQWLDFDEVTIEFEDLFAEIGTFGVRPLRPLASPLLNGGVVPGRFRFGAGLVVTALAVAAPR